MAKITINEVDNSSASVLTGDENIVFVPGYAVKGPVNTPTLCKSYAEFVEKFGAAPYVFKHDQTYDGTPTSEVMVPAGGYERSYLYAAELLKAGLPVLFDRLLSGTGNKASAVLHFKNKEHYAEAVGTASAPYRAVKLGEDEETEGVWTLYSVNATTGEETEVTDTYTITESEDGESVTIVCSAAGINASGLDIEERTAADSRADQTVTLTAKYPGAYGASITYQFKEPSGLETEDDRLYQLIINNTTYYVSFKETSDYYILTKLADNPDVDVTLSLTSAFITNNFFNIVAKEVNVNFTYEDDSSDEMTYADIRAILAGASNPFDIVSDKTVYDVKFITSGAYASFDQSSASIAQNMLDCAATRKDALALPDGKKGISKSILKAAVTANFPTTVISGEDRNKYGSIFAPNVKVRLSTTKTDEWMPGSFVYLYALAQSVVNNPIWLAIAGVTRGIVSNYKDIEYVVDEATADSWQAETGVSINPIMNIRPYGVCIYGNRTLLNNIEGLTASSFTNIRVLVNEAKKVTLVAINSLMFESNDIVLWNNFKAAVEPTLQQMKSNRGLSDYKIIRGTTSKKATVAGTIKLMPIEAVENFEITFSLEDNVATVE